MENEKICYCPFCGRGYSFPEERLGTVLTCRMCGSEMMRTQSTEKTILADTEPVTVGESFTRDGFTVRDGLLVSYAGTAPCLTVPEEVVAIGGGAFEGNTALREIALPESVRYIGHKAFAGCEGLRKVSLPKGLLAIGNCAFEDCRRLVRVAIPKSLRAAGYAIFNRCDNLVEADFPMDLSFIGGAPHPFCRRLVRTQVPHCVQSISFWLAENDALETITLGRRIRTLQYVTSPRLFEVILTHPEGWAYSPTRIPWDGTYERIDAATLAHPKKAAQFFRKLQTARRSICRPDLMAEPEDPYYLEVEE